MTRLDKMALLIAAMDADRRNGTMTIINVEPQPEVRFLDRFIRQPKTHPTSPKKGRRP